MSQQRVLIIAVILFIVGMVGGNLLSKQFQATSVEPIFADAPTSEAATGGNGIVKVASTASGSSSFLKRLRPDFSLPDLEGNTRTAGEWDGKVVVVNFWATWCAPCRKEIPAFNELQKKYGDQGVQFIGIALDDAKAVERFMKVIPIDYPVLIGDDDGIPLAKQYGNVDGVLPYTVFVNRDGGIASIAAGGLSETVAENALLKLL